MNREALIAALVSRNTAADRFTLAAIKQLEERGGRPTAELVDGKIVFTYPDGTRTCGGRRL